MSSLAVLAMGDGANDASDKPTLDGDAASPPSESLRYSTDLFPAFAEVCQKAKSGVQSCQAVALFVQERANAEATYARAMLKIAQNATCEDWAPGFSKCWSVVQQTLEGIAKDHAECAAKMQTTIVAPAKAFAAQQEVQVQRLIAEGTKFRTAQQNMLTSMERAKEKYDRKCADAIEITASMNLRRTESTETVAASSSHATTTSMPTSTSTPTTATPPTSETANDETKVAAQAAQMLTKMWDTTSSFAKPSMERQRSKLDGCLEEVIAAEKQYTLAVEYVNAQRLVLEREITENLHAFQLTEEQRIEYLKDILVRMEKSFTKMIQSSRGLVDKLKETASGINEFVDIEQGFRKLSGDVNPDVAILDPSDNSFSQRMVQIQMMSDRGHQIVRVVSTTVTDLMAIEDQYASSLLRLSKTHETTAPGSGDLFGMSNSIHVCDEGVTMTNGWKSAKDQVQRVAEIHQEFRSLLAEPVSLSISTMKSEYENARAATQESFAKSHSALSQDVSTYQKLKLKATAKAREFAQVFASLPDMGGTDLNNLDVDQALVLVQQLSDSFSEKDKRTESKLKLLAEELRDVQRRFDESDESLKKRSRTYIQDIDVFISLYMKNEKFRLQVEKSSLQSLAKALDHMFTGESAVAVSTINVLYVIDSVLDVADFIRSNRKPYEKSRRVTPTYHNDEALKSALEDFYATRATASANASPASTPPDEKKQIGKQSTMTQEQPSPLKRTKSGRSAGSPGVTSSDASRRPASTDDEKDGQPLAVSDFQKKFKLVNPEQVVESFSCALYMNNFPNHGRLYLTPDHMCFNGWRDTIYVIDYNDVKMMEKKNTALIVPNAIEVSTSTEKVFFSSFVFRDECFQCIQQLMAIKKATTAAMNDKKVREAKETPSALEISSSDHHADTNVPTTDEVPSPTMQAPVTPARTSLSTTTTNTTASSVAGVPQHPVIKVPAKDTLLEEFEIVVDEEVPFSVDFAHSTVWVESDAFIHGLLVAGGETNINLGKWTKQPLSYTAVTKSDNFDGSRCVTYTHNKKYMVGPSSIPTTQTQRFKWEPHSQLIISVTSTVTDAPYCDYFRAESRWVFSATKKPGVCCAQVGIRIQWLKSTWLKKQIESTAMGEAKDATRALLAAAVKESKKHGASTNVDSAAPLITSSQDTTPTVSALTKKTESSTTSSVTAVAAMDDVSKATKVEVERSATSHVPVVPHKPAMSYLMLANAFCVLVFIYTMHRICVAMEQMQLLTKESLMQQKQQQELLQALLTQLQANAKD